MLQSIENLHDVAEFTRSVVRNGVNLHPDDDFLQLYQPQDRRTDIHKGRG